MTQFRTERLKQRDYWPPGIFNPSGIGNVFLSVNHTYN